MSRRRTERIEAERWAWIFPSRAREDEVRIAQCEAWTLQPHHRERCVLLLTNTRLYVCVVEGRLARAGRPYVTDLVLAGQEVLAMSDTGLILVQSGHEADRVSTVLDLIPEPESWQFTIHLRQVFEQQSHFAPKGVWKERPTTKQERKRWESATGGYTTAAAQ